MLPPIESGVSSLAGEPADCTELKNTGTKVKKNTKTKKSLPEAARLLPVNAFLNLFCYLRIIGKKEPEYTREEKVE